MGKIRDWMHGKGRNIVIALLFLGAALMIADYVIEEHTERSGASGKATTAPAVLEQKKDQNTSSPPSLEQDENEEPDPTSSEEGQNKVGETDQELPITIGFAGDICLDEKTLIMKHMREKGEGLAGCIDKRLLRRMRQQDFMVLNNEFAFSDRGAPMAGKAYTFCADTKNISLLKKMGVDAVSLANNHVFDYGETAFFDTLHCLKQAGIRYAGGGANAKEAKKPVYFRKNGKVIAVVAATRAEKYILTPEAGKNSPGVFRTYDDTAYTKAIARAKKCADVVIAFVHWGTEYSTVLEEAQKQQAKDYIDAGADVVVGAHTHCMQGIGYYKGKPIFYSLGNFWFNEKTLYTTLLELAIDPNGEVTARMQPCLQADKETKLLTGKKKRQKFVQYINSISTNGKLNNQGIVMRKDRKN